MSLSCSCAIALFQQWGKCLTQAHQSTALEDSRRNAFDHIEDEVFEDLCVARTVFAWLRLFVSCPQLKQCRRCCWVIWSPCCFVPFVHTFNLTLYVVVYPLSVRGKTQVSNPRFCLPIPHFGAVTQPHREESVQWQCWCRPNWNNWKRGEKRSRGNVTLWGAAWFFLANPASTGKEDLHGFAWGMFVEFSEGCPWPLDDALYYIVMSWVTASPKVTSLCVRASSEPLL